MGLPYRLLAGTVPQALLVLTALLCGLHTHSSATTYALAVVLPVLWAWSKDRMWASLVAFAYYAAASWPVASAVSDYAPHDARFAGWGWLAWFVVVAVGTLPWMVLYRRDERWLFTRLATIATLTLLPPAGLVQPAWPFLGAAWWLPGYGLISVGLTVLALRVIARRPILALIPVCVSLLSFTSPRAQPLRTGPWVAVDTRVPMGTHTLNFQAAHRALRRFASARPAHTGSPRGTRHYVLPESIAGLTPAMAADALRRQPGETVFAGGLQGQSNGTLRAVFFEYSEAHPQGQTIYQQRIPVPFLSGESMQLLSTPVINRGVERIGFLLCFEGFTAWAPFSAAVFGATRLVVGANFAFLEAEPRISTMYRAHLGAWSRLFGVPASIAINRHPLEPSGAL